MKKVFMSMAIVAAMFAAASCACNNTPKEAEAAEPCCEQTECCDSTKCADCTECCDSTKCAGCDSTATDCCKAE
ncbi:MAG: hypothetical protein IJB06_05645 [Bacteroidales bacterium]|nr:hypothetical protein [Bacteroidales bacterium]